MAEHLKLVWSEYNRFFLGMDCVKQSEEHFDRYLEESNELNDLD